MNILTPIQIKQTKTRYMSLGLNQILNLYSRYAGKGMGEVLSGVVITSKLKPKEVDALARQYLEDVGVHKTVKMVKIDSTTYRFEFLKERI